MRETHMKLSLKLLVLVVVVTVSGSTALADSSRWLDSFVESMRFVKSGLQEANEGLDLAVTIVGIAAGGGDDYEYDADELQVLGDLLSGMSPFEILGGHYQYQARLLEEQRAALPLAQFDRGSVSEERLKNCLTFGDEAGRVTRMLQERQALHGELDLARLSFEMATESMFKPEWSAHTGAGRRLVAEGMRDFFAEAHDAMARILEVPDPFGVVRTQAALNILVLQDVTLPGLGALEDAVNRMQTDLENRVDESQGGIDYLLSLQQQSCRFEGVWRGRCDFPSTTASTEAELQLTRTGDDQAGSFVVKGTNFLVQGSNGEIIDYNVPPATLPLDSFRAFAVPQMPIGIEFRLGTTASSPVFHGWLSNSMTDLMGSIGDSSAARPYMACSLFLD